MVSSDLNVVLVEPEIPQNAGNIGRTCVAVGARLHLVGRLGFSVDDKDVRRAGLDYWQHLALSVHPTWDVFMSSVPAEATMRFFSTRGTARYFEAPLAKPLYLVFGSESRGLPPSFYDRYAASLVKIPQRPEARSLNLATSVGIVAYDAARRLELFPADGL